MDGLAINLATVRKQWGFAEAVDGCLRHGITAIAPWRDQIEAIGLAEARRIVESNGVRVSCVCRGGMFTAGDTTALRAAIEDNKRAIDEAATLGADCLVLVVGGLPHGSRDLPAARRQVAAGIAAVLPHARANDVPLAIEPLHPMYAADRACVSTLAQALDLCDELDDGVGVVVDTYHVWWDPELPDQLARAGVGKRILAHHIADWLVPTRDLLNDRGMPGDGVIDFKGIRSAIERAGYSGPQEIEIFSTEHWWKEDGDDVLATCIERYRTICRP
jgi:sugar phosphate isomerase/epimerase